MASEQGIQGELPIAAERPGAGASAATASEPSPLPASEAALDPPRPTPADSLAGAAAALATSPSLSLASGAAAGLVSEAECKGIRSTSDFPKTLTGLTPERIAHHYAALRNSHASLSRSRGQLLRRSREFSAAREQFLTTLRRYEQRLLAIGAEKAEAMRLAQDMHRELEAFEARQQSLDRLLDDLDTAKQEAGFWSVHQINRLLQRMRELLRGGRPGDG